MITCILGTRWCQKGRTFKVEQILFQPTVTFMTIHIRTLTLIIPPFHIILTAFLAFHKKLPHVFMKVCVIKARLARKWLRGDTPRMSLSHLVYLQLRGCSSIFHFDLWQLVKQAWDTLIRHIIFSNSISGFQIQTIVHIWNRLEIHPRNHFKTFPHRIRLKIHHGNQIENSFRNQDNRIKSLGTFFQYQNLKIYCGIILKSCCWINLKIHFRTRMKIRSGITWEIDMKKKYKQKTRVLKSCTMMVIQCVSQW